MNSRKTLNDQGSWRYLASLARRFLVVTARTSSGGGTRNGASNGRFRIRLRLISAWLRAALAPMTLERLSAICVCHRKTSSRPATPMVFLVFGQREVLSRKLEVVAIDAFGVLCPKHVEIRLARFEHRIEADCGDVVVFGSSSTLSRLNRRSACPLRRVEQLRAAGCPR